MVARITPRVQAIIFPHLRLELPGVTVGSWYGTVDQRQFPLLNIKRLGGTATDPQRIDKPVIELTAYGKVSLPDTEDLYMDARQVLLEMVDDQVVTTAGHLNFFREVMGPTPYDAPFENTWRVQGLIQLGVRPPQ